MLGKLAWSTTVAISTIAASTASVVHDLTKHNYKVIVKQNDTKTEQIREFTLEPKNGGGFIGDVQNDWAHAVATIPKGDGHKDLGVTGGPCKTDELLGKVSTDK